MILAFSGCKIRIFLIAGSGEDAERTAGVAKSDMGWRYALDKGLKTNWLQNWHSVGRISGKYKPYVPQLSAGRDPKSPEKQGVQHPQHYGPGGRNRLRRPDPVIGGG